jgi:hypothetical protein
MGLSQETNRMRKLMSETEKILKDHENRILALEKAILKHSVEEVISETFGIEKFSAKLNLEVEKLRSIYDVEGSSLTVLQACSQEDPEKIKNITLLALLGYKNILGKDRILSKEIRRNVTENRIPVNNFSTYVNELIPSQIRRIGKPKSSITMYKLTPLGEAEAKEIVKELCK